MVENLETLIELQKQQTMMRTASALRISQSAVSKRISAIEAHYGIPLVEKNGRNIRLTSEAEALIAKTRPILNDLKDALKPGSESVIERPLNVGVSESILSSWGASFLEDLSAKLGIELEYHSHRSPLVIEKVESGIFDLGLCSGQIKNPRSVVSEAMTKEELVLVASKPSELSLSSDKLLVIESTSATWKAVKGEVRTKGLKPYRRVESFFSLCQLARSGHGVGLVPKGVAKALGVPDNCIKSLSPKMYRPVQIVYKKSLLERSNFQKFVSKIKSAKNPL